MKHLLCRRLLRAGEKTFEDGLGIIYYCRLGFPVQRETE